MRHLEIGGAFVKMKKDWKKLKRHFIVEHLDYKDEIKILKKTVHEAK